MTPVKFSMSGVILAGGRSTRMGRDKALLRLGSQTVLESLCALLASFCEEIFVIVDAVEKCEGLNLSGAYVRTDLFKEQGPLAGLYTALSYAEFPALCVLSCDMPWVTPAALETLHAQWTETLDMLCFKDENNRRHPFPGIYARHTKSLVRLLMDQGEFSVNRFFSMAIAETVSWKFGTKEKNIFMNMNAPEDYEHVLRASEEKVL